MGESGKTESSQNGTTTSYDDDAISSSITNDEDLSEETLVAEATTVTSIINKFHSGDWAILVKFLISNLKMDH